jgi:hypothetical protein
MRPNSLRITPMSPPRFYPPSRPQSVGEVLDTGFRIFQSTLLPCLPYGVVWVIVGQLANLHELAAGRPLRAFGGADLAGWIWYVCGALLMLLIWSSLILRQSALASGVPSSMAAELRAVLAGLPQLLALVLVGAVAAAVGLLLLVVPGLYLIVAFTFAMPAMLTLRLGPLAALKYCVRLVRGNWWRTTLILGVATIIILVLYTVLVSVTLIAFGAGGSVDVAVVTAVSRAAGIALGAVIAPFACAMILATFGELRARREGADLEGHAARAAG